MTTDAQPRAPRRPPALFRRTWFAGLSVAGLLAMCCSSGEYNLPVAWLVLSVAFAVCWTHRPWRASPRDARLITSLALALALMWLGVLCNRAYLDDREGIDLFWAEWSMEVQYGDEITPEVRGSLFHTGFPIRRILGQDARVFKTPVADMGIPPTFWLFDPLRLRRGLGVLWPNLGLLWMAAFWLIGWIPPRQRGWTAVVFHVSAALLTIPGCIVAQSGGSW